jgi:aspartate racemase
MKKNNNNNKTIGVLGGMGPGASASLYNKMIEYAQYKYGAVQDADYPPIIIYSLPLLGFDETGVVDEDLVKEQLISGVKKLESAGCDMIIIACNTVHIYYEDMQVAVNVPILNIIEKTRERVMKVGYKKVGLLASESTNKLQIYQKKFSEVGVEIISPNEAQQDVINGVIEHVMGGSQNVEDIIVLKGIIRNYLNQGAEAVILGCTEIPLAINQVDTDVELFDATKAIVELSVDYSVGVSVK